MEFDGEQISDRMIRSCLRFLGRTEQYEAVTITGPHTAATFAHGRDKWVQGGHVEIYLFDNSKHVCEITKIDHQLDVIYLESTDELIKPEGTRRIPGFRLKYLLLGYSVKTVPHSLSITEGLITSDEANGRRHILGSSGSNLGDSGGPVVEPFTQKLLGMNVGNEMMEVDEATKLGDLGTRYPARNYIVSTIFL